MLRLRFGLLTLSTLLLSAACSERAPSPTPDAAVSDSSAPETDGETDGETGAATTVSTFCRAVSERTCAGMTKCGCSFELRPYTAEACVEARTASCVSSFGVKIQPDLDAGRSSFHEPSVTRCLAAVDAMVAACAAAESGLPDECSTAVMDVAAASAPCTVTGGGLAFCAGGEGVCRPEGAARVCTRLPGEGGTCVAGLCAPGFGCDGESCRARGPEGSACTTSATCSAGLNCTPDGSCAAPRPAGEACSDTSHCATGVRCSEGECTAGVALGGGCNAPSECGAGRGCERTPSTRVCGTADTAGQPCTPGSCASGLTCDGGSCVALPRDGAPCLGSQCASGFTCIDGESVCRKLPGVGETCLSGARFCADGLGCDMSTNTCQAGPGAGKECLLNPPDYVCAAGFGCQFGDSGNTCVALGAAGAACTDNRTCTADTFCDWRPASAPRASRPARRATAASSALPDGSATAASARRFPAPGSRVWPRAPPASPARAPQVAARRSSAWRPEEARQYGAARLTSAAARVTLATCRRTAPAPPSSSSAS